MVINAKDRFAELPEEERRRFSSALTRSTLRK